MVLTINSTLSRSRPSLKFGIHSMIFFMGNPPFRKQCQPPVISLAQLSRGLKIEGRRSRIMSSVYGGLHTGVEGHAARAAVHFHSALHDVSFSPFGCAKRRGAPVANY